MYVRMYMGNNKDYDIRMLHGNNKDYDIRMYMGNNKDYDIRMLHGNNKDYDICMYIHICAYSTFIYYIITNNVMIWLICCIHCKFTGFHMSISNSIFYASY